MGRSKMLKINDAALSFDTVVLVLTTTRLLKSPGRSSLWHLLFRQGIVYFIVALIAYILLATFLLLNLNRTYFLNLMVLCECP